MRYSSGLAMYCTDVCSKSGTPQSGATSGSQMAEAEQQENHTCMQSVHKAHTEFTAHTLCSTLRTERLTVRVGVRGGLYT